eukprot:GHVT01064601.1.p1 GENE.GHVT01064601.1~~GHVT01064601.1.p1  ORF type:complete len:689 (+),score=8.39 GHVT01064601.1:257-2068(+)
MTHDSPVDEPRWEEAKRFIPWLKDTELETRLNSPFGDDAIAVYRTLTALSSKPRMVEMLCSSRDSRQTLNRLPQLIELNTWPGTRVRLMTHSDSRAESKSTKESENLKAILNRTLSRCWAIAQLPSCLRPNDMARRLLEVTAESIRAVPMIQIEMQSLSHSSRKLLSGLVALNTQRDRGHLVLGDIATYYPNAVYGHWEIMQHQDPDGQWVGPFRYACKRGQTRFALTGYDNFLETLEVRDHRRVKELSSSIRSIMAKNGWRIRRPNLGRAREKRLWLDPFRERTTLHAPEQEHYLTVLESRALDWQPSLPLRAGFVLEGEKLRLEGSTGTSARIDSLWQIPLNKVTFTHGNREMKKCDQPPLLFDISAAGAFRDIVRKFLAGKKFQIGDVADLDIDFHTFCYSNDELKPEHEMTDEEKVAIFWRNTFDKYMEDNFRLKPRRARAFVPEPIPPHERDTKRWIHLSYGKDLATSNPFTDLLFEGPGIPFVEDLMVSASTHGLSGVIFGPDADVEPVPTRMSEMQVFFKLDNPFSELISSASEKWDTGLAHGALAFIYSARESLDVSRTFSSGNRFFFTMARNQKEDTPSPDRKREDSDSEPFEV